MVLTPFYLLASIVLLDRDFDFLEHPACDTADCITKGIYRLTGIEIEYVEEIFLLKVNIRVIRATGVHTVGDADCDCPSEGHFDVILIITFQVTIRNDVEDGLLVVLPILNSQLIGNFL